MIRFNVIFSAFFSYLEFYFNLLLAYCTSAQNHFQLYDAFDKLRIERMSIAAYRGALIAHANPSNLASALVKLQRNGSSIPAYLGALIAHANPSNLAIAFIKLERNGISIQDYLSALIAHHKPIALSDLLIHLKRHGISIEKYRDVLIAQEIPRDSANVLALLKQIGMLTPLNLRHFLVYGDTSRLTISSAIMQINEKLFEAKFQHLHAVLILTSNEPDYDRIHALIPKRFHKCIQPIESYRAIIEIQQRALANVDLFDLHKTRLPYYLFRYIQEYEGRLTQLPLPCHENELTQYKANLHIALSQFQQAKALNMLQDKLQRFITSARAAISTAQVSPSMYKLFLLEEKQVQIHAIQKLITWLSDDKQTLSVAEAALLGTHAVVRLLLDNSTLTLPKLTELKEEFWRYDQERSSLHQQRFLLGLEGHSLWANRQNSPQAQAAFDSAYGIIIKP